MAKWFLTAGLLSLIVVSLYAQSVSSTDLIEHAKEWDGRDIVYEGEAIGDIMPRQEGAWVNLFDGSNAIGVWMPHELAKQIKFCAGFTAKGDYLQIEGRFNRACGVHGGDLDIHCQKILEIKEGRVVKNPLVPQKLRIISVLMGVSLCLMILQILRRKLAEK